MSDNLKDRISTEVKQAMRERKTQRLAALRLLQAAIKQREVDERIELTDQDVISIIEKQVKQRKESIQAFLKADRADSAETEQQELEVLQEFLPQQADAAEIDAAISEVVQQLQADGVNGGAAMGKAMGILKNKFSGRADMSEISAKLKEQLNK